MAYFLKKSKNQKGTYLLIYESYYNTEKKQTAHRSIKPIGYVEDLIKNGLEDPISYYQNVIAQMNQDKQSKKKELKKRKVTEHPPIFYYGYFPLKSIHNALDVTEEINNLGENASFHGPLFDLLSVLIYAHMILPDYDEQLCIEALSYLYEDTHFSSRQIQEGSTIFAHYYEAILKIYTEKIHDRYNIEAPLVEIESHRNDAFTKERIKAGFLISYLSALLLRILETKGLHQEFSHEEILDYVRNAKFVEVSSHQFLNLTKRCAVMDRLQELTKLPLDVLHLTDSDLQKIMHYQFKF